LSLSAIFAGVLDCLAPIALGQPVTPAWRGLWDRRNRALHGNDDVFDVVNGLGDAWIAFLLAHPGPQRTKPATQGRQATPHAKVASRYGAVTAISTEDKPLPQCAWRRLHLQGAPSTAPAARGSLEGAQRTWYTAGHRGEPARVLTMSCFFSSDPRTE